MTIDSNNLETYLLGASALACGGGLPREVAASMLDGVCVEVVSVDTFAPTDVLASVYGIGSVADTRAEVDFGLLALRAIKGLQELIGQPIAGLVSGEIGGEASVFLAADRLGVKVVDADLVGGRAAPEVIMDCYGVNEIPVGPFVLACSDGEVIVVDEVLDGGAVEERARGLLKERQVAGVLAAYAQPVEVVGDILPKETLTQAMEVGIKLSTQSETLRGSETPLLEGFSCVRSGDIVSVVLDDRDGFLVGTVGLEDGTMLIVKNEVLGLYQGASLVVSAPDLIVVLCDGLPVHTTDLRIGQRVEVFVGTSHSCWRSRKARAVLGPSYVQHLYRFVQGT